MERQITNERQPYVETFADELWQNVKVITERKIGDELPAMRKDD